MIILHTGRDRKKRNLNVPSLLPALASSLDKKVTGRTQNLCLPRVIARGWQECCWDEIGSGMFPGSSIPADPRESWLLAYFSE